MVPDAPQLAGGLFTITEALNKREQLAKDFSSLASNVNPLMLIQLPDRSAVTDTLKEEIIGILKNKHNITVENGKLAIWLSEEKQNRDTISLNDDKAEVMIFKQAIAIGWDCPRAHILLTLRDMQSPIFTIQTVGRILRMPELKHYSIDSLNIGYIYTDMPAFTIKGDESFGYIVAQNAKRKDTYQNIDLPSVHSKRHREETRLSPKFISCFLKAAEELKLKELIDMDVKEISKTLMTDVKIENIDKAKENKTGYITEHISLVQQETEIQHEFELFIVEHLSVFPEKRSVSRVKEAIYYFFKNNYPFKSIETAMQKVVLKESNTQHFVNAINKAKELYEAEVGKGKSTLILEPCWNVLQSQSYNENYSAVQVKLCIVEPFYQKNGASQPEKDFTLFLDSKINEVEWWYKNGENDAIHFAIPYDDNGTPRSFYIDWVVKYKDGRIGLFDTKSGQTAETAKAKAEGLYKYIKEQNSKGKNLFGGIVIHQSGSWRYNGEETYEFNKDGLKSWKFLP